MLYFGPSSDTGSSLPTWLEFWEPWMSVVAFVLAVVAVPAIFQQFGGPAKTWFEFKRLPTTDINKIGLIVEATNRPPRKALRWMGVHRNTSQQATVGFGVFDMKGANNRTGGLVTPPLQTIDSGAADPLDQPFVLSVDQPFVMQVAVKTRGTTDFGVVLPGPKNLLLPIGTYRVEVFGHIRERGKSFYDARYLLAGLDNLAWGKKAKPRIRRKGGVRPKRDVVATPRLKDKDAPPP